MKQVVEFFQDSFSKLTLAQQRKLREFLFDLYFGYLAEEDYDFNLNDQGEEEQFLEGVHPKQKEIMDLAIKTLDTERVRLSEIDTIQDLLAAHYLESVYQTENAKQSLKDSESTSSLDDRGDKIIELNKKELLQLFPDLLDEAALVVHVRKLEAEKEARRR